MKEKVNLPPTHTQLHGIQAILRPSRTKIKNSTSQALGINHALRLIKMLTIYVDSHSSPEPSMERLHDGKEEIYESGFQSVFQKSPSPEISISVKLPDL